MSIENYLGGKLLKKIFFTILRKSIEKSLKKRNFSHLKSKLEKIVPQISNQYSSKEIDANDKFTNMKLRGLHTFQIKFITECINNIKRKNNFENKTLNVVDIGDSSGTHSQYLLGLDRNKDNLNLLSIDIDPLSVEKIKTKGLKAICGRAEDLHKLNINFKPDIMFSLQMMEHLTDPIRFLYNLSKNNVSEYMLFTVPYVSKSRVGLKHLRQKDGRIVSPEECHIFELSPSDWELACKFSGWEVIERDIYLQYPPFHLLSFTKPLWRTYDFEGFCGIFLKRKFDLTRQYTGW